MRKHQLLKGGPVKGAKRKNFAARTTFTPTDLERRSYQLIQDEIAKERSKCGP